MVAVAVVAVGFGVAARVVAAKAVAARVPAREGADGC
jgi:hypothetical protein